MEKRQKDNCFNIRNVTNFSFCVFSKFLLHHLKKPTRELMRWLYG